MSCTLAICSLMILVTRHMTRYTKRILPLVGARSRCLSERPRHIAEGPTKCKGERPCERAARLRQFSRLTDELGCGIYRMGNLSTMPDRRLLASAGGLRGIGASSKLQQRLTWRAATSGDWLEPCLLPEDHATRLAASVGRSVASGVEEDSVVDPTAAEGIRGSVVRSFYALSCRLESVAHKTETSRASIASRQARPWHRESSGPPLCCEPRPSLPS